MVVMCLDAVCVFYVRVVLSGLQGNKNRGGVGVTHEGCGAGNNASVVAWPRVSLVWLHVAWCMSSFSFSSSFFWRVQFAFSQRHQMIFVERDSLKKWDIVRGQANWAPVRINFVLVDGNALTVVTCNFCDGKKLRGGGVWCVLGSVQVTTVWFVACLLFQEASLLPLRILLLLWNAYLSLRGFNATFHTCIAFCFYEF